VSVQAFCEILRAIERFRTNEGVIGWIRGRGDRVSGGEEGENLIWNRKRKERGHEAFRLRRAGEEKVREAQAAAACRPAR